MTNKLKLITASVVFCAIAGNPALANSMRCGTHLITGSESGSPAAELHPERVTSPLPSNMVTVTLIQKLG
jgi:hypothetical protein